MIRNHQRRAGFTLVELLMVVVIIGTLIAILVPTIAAAFRTAKQASVVAEITNMATALNDFKTKFGDYPPSRVLLSESGYSATLLSSTGTIVGQYAAVTDINEGQLAQRSLLYLRKFFPRCTFNPTSSTARGNFYDFNGDGAVHSGYYVLSGSECLAFFLGGMPNYVGGSGYQSNGLGGFGRLPTNPFIDSATSGTNRTTSLFEFSNGRLVDLDGDGVPSYCDALASPPGDRHAYAYFSSYGSNGYDPNDVNDNGHIDSAEVDDITPTPVTIARAFTTSFNASNVVSTAPNPYTTNAPVSVATNFFNPNSFQLFSSGYDRLWGLGGIYLPNATGGSRLPLNDPANTNLTFPDDTEVVTRGNDNLTNFSSGRLD